MNGVLCEEAQKLAKPPILQDSGQITCTSKSSSRFRLILFFLLILFILTILLIAFWVVLYSKLPCTLPMCTLTSARILERIDVSTRPCDDFYQFACGKWINQSVNINYGAWNTLYETQMKAQDRIVNAITKILDGTFEAPVNNGEKSAAQFYKQCTDLETLDTIGLKAWREFVDRIGGWLSEMNDPRPVINDEFEIEDAILLAFNYSVFPLFWAGVEVNYFNSTSHLLTIYEQVPILIDTSLYRFNKELTIEMIMSKQDGPSVTRALQQIGEELADLMYLDSKDPKIKRMIARMVDLEYRITVSGSTFYKEKRERYEVVSLEKLQKIAPAINWHYFFTHLINEPLEKHEQIAIKTGAAWISALSDIINDLKESREGIFVIKNYIKWKTMLFHLAYASPNCREGLLWNAVNLYSGPRNQRKEFCMLRLSGIFPLSLPSILRKIDGPEISQKNKEMTEKIAENIAAEYIKILQSSDLFSDKNTLQNAVDKIAQLTKLIGYPEKMISDTEMIKESGRLSTELFWSMVLGTSAVYREKLSRLRVAVGNGDWIDSRPALSMPIYNYERNLIQIPFDVLRIPFTDFSQLDFANYAGVGTIIGHELTHAFDKQGKLHGKTGNLGRWWSNESIERFNSNEKCFILQYASFTDSDDILTAKAGLYENIADHAGLKVAYEAWKLHGRNQSKRLAGLEEYTQDQLFFLAYAQGWCALKPKQTREVHMEEKYRMIGSLQNSAEFGEAWMCPKNTFMNPSRKCNIW